MFLKIIFLTPNKKLTFDSRESAILAKNISRDVFQSQPEVKVRFGREKSGSPSAAAPPPDIKRTLEPASNPFEDEEPTTTSTITTGLWVFSFEQKIKNQIFITCLIICIFGISN